MPESIVSKLDQETQQVVQQISFLRNVTSKIDALKGQVKAGKLSDSEYMELVNDLLDLDKITKFADDLELQTKIIKTAKVLIAVAKLAI